MKELAWRQLATTSIVGLWNKRGSLTPRGLCAVSTVITALICYLTFISARWVSPSICGQYKRLKREERREWDTRYFSCIHAALVTYLAYVALVKDDTFYAESSVPVLSRSSHTTYLSLGLSMGYFLVDLYVCLNFKVGGPAMAAHHMAAFASVLWASWSGFGHMPTLWLLGTEFTTPFINLRWWLDKAGMKTSRLYLANGLTIVFSWLFARILSFIPFYREVWRIRHEFSMLDWPSRVLLLVVPLLLMVLNSIWFVQIVKGAVKVFARSQDIAAHKQEVATEAAHKAAVAAAATDERGKQE